MNSGTAVLGALSGFGGKAKASAGVAIFAAITATASNQTIHNGLTVTVTMTAVDDKGVAFTSNVTSTTPYTVVYSPGVTFISNGTITTTFTAAQVIEILMISAATATDAKFSDFDSSQTWVLNAKNMGSTRYTNFGFNSYAKVGTKFYGLRSDGLYKLDGPTDAGTAIASKINLGKTDFGSSLLKSLVNCYIGSASNGAMVLKVVADGNTYYYTARDTSTTLQTQRIDVGRGFRASYFELELQNTAGGAFELATIEFTPIQLSRRI